MPWAAYGTFSGFHLFLNPEGRSLRPDRFDPFAVDYRELKANPPGLADRLRLAMLSNGVDVNGWPGGVISAAHGEAEFSNALRALIHLGGMVGWVYTLTLIPLVTAAALVFSTPLFVAVGAVLFFGERPGVQRRAGIGLGLVGVLIIMRPGVEAVSLGALVVLGASVLQGAAKMMVKVIVRTDSTMSAVFHLNVLMALFGLVPTLIFWRTPTLAHLGWFALMGAVGAVAHYSLTRAIEHADFTALQPFEFAQLGWAALLGYAFFAEVPANHVVLGGAVIVAATSWMVHYEARRGRRSGASGE